MKVNSSIAAFLQIIGLIFFHKQFRSCQTETVNALFYIPYHKQIVDTLRLATDPCQNHLLNQITVLIFVNHNVLIIICQISCCLSTRADSVLTLHQNLQCQMLQVVKITEIPFSFFLCITVRKLFCQIQ